VVTPRDTGRLRDCSSAPIRCNHWPLDRDATLALVSTRMRGSAKTYCRVCEAACGLEVDFDASGTPFRIRPDREHPVSAGYACAKGTRFLEVARHPERVLVPRVDGRDVSWDDAIATAARRIDAVRQKYGPHAVGLYFGNPIAFNAFGLVALLAFTKSLGTRNVFSASSQDCNNKFAGARIVHGSTSIHPVPDFERCDLAIVLGSNPFVSQSSFVHLPRGATVFDRIRSRGGDVVWIDPRRTESARRGGTHLAIRPGTDLWLLLALLGRLGPHAPRERTNVEGFAELLALARTISIDEAATRTGLAAADIVALADRIAKADRCAMHMSVGVNQGGFGTMAYVVMQALVWATGNYDREGGSIVHPMADVLARLFAAGGLDPDNTSRIGDFGAVLGTVPGGVLADEILEPGEGRIRALVVVAGDPLRSIPGESRIDRALASLDTLVTIDMFANATGRRADVVLPATSWPERWDLAATTLTFQTHALVQTAGPVMRPVGAARHDARILGDLAIALGSKNPLWRLTRLPLERMPSPKFGFRGLRPRPGKRLRKHGLRLWHASFPAEVDRLRSVAIPDADAFTLICRRRRLGHNGWLHGGVRDGNSESAAWMNARDMAELAVKDGELVEIDTGAAAITVAVRADEGLAVRTIVLPHGLPEHNVNAMIPSGAAAIERLSGQHTMTGIPARVRAIPATAQG
jgi:anaerobic selenocysteine-containing dehydrogenase